MNTSKRSRTQAYLDQTDGPPFTTAEVARLFGMSPTFVRKEIKNGALQAVVLGRGRRRVYRIPVGEVVRYMRRAGLLPARGRWLNPS
jgi:excisionase family DNA binding protein